MLTRQTVALIEGLDKVLGRGSLFAYLVHMTQRIVEIHRVLKPTGSFYLHCDPTASALPEAGVRRGVLRAGRGFPQRDHLEAIECP